MTRPKIAFTYSIFFFSLSNKQLGWISCNSSQINFLLSFTQLSNWINDLNRYLHCDRIFHWRIRTWFGDDFGELQTEFKKNNPLESWLLKEEKIGRKRANRNKNFHIFYLWTLNSSVNNVSHRLHHLAKGHWSAWKMIFAIIPADCRHASIYNDLPNRWPFAIRSEFRRHHLVNRCCWFLAPNWMIPSYEYKHKKNQSEIKEEIECRRNIRSTFSKSSLYDNWKNHLKIHNLFSKIKTTFNVL